MFGEGRRLAFVKHGAPKVRLSGLLIGVVCLPLFSASLCAGLEISSCSTEPSSRWQRTGNVQKLETHHLAPTQETCRLCRGLRFHEVLQKRQDSPAGAAERRIHYSKNLVEL